MNIIYKYGGSIRPLKSKLYTYEKKKIYFKHHDRCSGNNGYSYYYPFLGYR